MRLIKYLPGLACVIAVTSMGSIAQQQGQKKPERDAQSLEILSRAVQTAGGEQAVASVHGIRERGQVTFHWGEGVKGPVTLLLLGANHYRMEARVLQEESTWVVNNGQGWKRELGKKVEGISTEDAVNMGNWTFPIGYVAAAVADATTEVSFCGIENKEARPAYRVRMKGRLGLVNGETPLEPISKELLLDANTFDIVSVADYPFQTYERGKRSDNPSREITFSDFRSVDGVQFPFSISVKVLGQRAMEIDLNQIITNDNVSEDDFQALK